MHNSLQFLRRPPAIGCLLQKSLRVIDYFSAFSAGAAGEGMIAPAAQATKSGERRRRTAGPCASSYRCSRHGVQSPGSCTQTLCTELADKWRVNRIGASAVQEGASSLSTCTRHRSAEIARGIKDQTATPGERVGADSSQAQWKFHHHISRDGVYVGLDSGLPSPPPKYSLVFWS